MPKGNKPTFAVGAALGILGLAEDTPRPECVRPQRSPRQMAHEAPAWQPLVELGTKSQVWLAAQ